MGNFEVISFEDFFEDLGIDLTAKTPQDIERLKLAFESAKDSEEFVREANKILNPER